MVLTSAAAVCVSFGACSRFSESTGFLGLRHCSSFHRAESVAEVTCSHSLSSSSRTFSSDLTRYHQCRRLLAIRRIFRWIATLFPTEVCCFSILTIVEMDTSFLVPQILLTEGTISLSAGATGADGGR